MLPRSFLLPTGKPGPAAGFGLPHAPAFAHQHVLHGRSSCAPPYAAATDIATAPAAAGDALLRAAAAARARTQQHADGRSSYVEPRPSYADKPASQGTGHLSRGVNGNSNAYGYQQQQQQQQPRQYQQQQQRQPQEYQQYDQQQQQELEIQQQRPPRHQQQQRPDQHQHRQRADRPQQQRQHQRPQAGRQQQHQSLPQQQQGQQQQQQQHRSFIKYQLGPEQDWSLPTGLAVTWLGTSSGTPTRDRNISCTLVRLPGVMYMVDCGEGSHRQARSTGLSLEQVETTFITHLHGDHCFGIGSMLVSLCSARRAQRKREQQQQQQQQQQREWPAGEGPGALRLVGPPKLGDLVSALLVGAGVGRRLDLPVYVTEFCEEDSVAHNWQPLPDCVPGQAFIRRLAPQHLSPEQLPARLQARLARTGLDWQHHPANTRRAVFQAKSGLVWRLHGEHATITAAQLQHRVPCWGYVFDELTPQEQQQQQEKEQQEKEKQQQGRRVLILGDTVDSRAIAAVACGADLVSHEATFAAGMEGKAAVAQHSTAWMAGQFAWAVEARSLVLTHFSARYEGSGSGGGGGGGGQQQGGRGGRGGQQDRRVRAWEVAQAKAEAEAADERAVKALQREAEEFFSQGPILLAADLFTAHVPTRQ